MTTSYYGPKFGSYPTVIRIALSEIAYTNQTTGQAINQYDVVYQDGGYWLRADSSTTANVPQRGIGIAVLSSVSGDPTFSVWIRGLVSNNSWNFVSGASVFMASGQGSAPIMSAPTLSGTWSYLLGRAITSSVLDLDPGTPGQIGQ